jgi:hypothetical protein
VTLEYRGRCYELDSNKFADGTLAPQCSACLRDFNLEYGLRVWRYTFEDAALE